MVNQQLSMISKTYDPLGLAAPFLFKGKRILQELCKSNFTWDDAVSDDYIVVWEKWKKELQLLENLKMERCFKPSKFGKVTDFSLHHFSDASQDCYGQVTYLRIVNENGYIKCSLVMAKSRVAPTKFVLTSHKCFKYVKKRFPHSFIQQSRNTFGQTERLYWVISITMQNLLKSFWQIESS